MNGVSRTLGGEVSQEEIGRGILGGLVPVNPQQEFTRPQDLTNVLGNFHLLAYPISKLARKGCQRLAGGKHFVARASVQEERSRCEQQKSGGKSQVGSPHLNFSLGGLPETARKSRWTKNSISNEMMKISHPENA